MAKKPATKGERARGYDLRIRIEQTKEKLLVGVSRPHLLEVLQKMWGVSQSRAYEYIKQAETEIREVVEGDRDRWLAEHIAIRRDIRRRANETGDLRLELDSAKDEAKLLGLDVVKVEHSGGVTLAVTEEIVLADSSQDGANPPHSA